ncbi:MAG TPA: hypothetical protein VKS79_05235 [Gemmataceae bacterium]|nr:hypothetical protein [Gemmataceae bacterium]
MTWLSLAIVVAAAPAQTPDKLPNPTPSVIRTPAVTSVAQAPQEQLPIPKADVPPKGPLLPAHPISPYAPLDYDHPVPGVAGFVHGRLPDAPPPLVTQPYRHPERNDPWLARNAGMPRWSHVERSWNIFKSRFDPTQSPGYLPPGTIRD